MRTPERCMCGDTECPSCGPAQGYGFDQDEVEEMARQIAVERLYSDPDEFSEVMEGIGSREVYKPLREALKVLSERGQWNNDGWMHTAIKRLDEVRQILESEQLRDTERFEDEARIQLSEEA